MSTDPKPIYVTQPYLPPLDEFIPYLEDMGEQVAHQQWSLSAATGTGVE